MNFKDFLVFSIFAVGFGGISWIALQWFYETFEAYVVFLPVLGYGLLATAVLLVILAVVMVALMSTYFAIRAIFKKDSVIND